VAREARNKRACHGDGIPEPIGQGRAATGVMDCARAGADGEAVGGGVVSRSPRLHARAQAMTHGSTVHASILGHCHV